MSETDKIQKVAIVGAGIQGSMIAFRNALHGKTVRAYSRKAESRKVCEDKIEQWAAWYVREGRLTKEEAEALTCRITLSGSLEVCLEDADLMIECVPEKLALKQELFGELDKLCPEKTYFNSNTSSLLMSDIYIHCSEERKAKTFSTDHDDPVRNSYLEMMWNPSTSEETKTAALAHYRTLGFEPVVTQKENKGYSVNRVWRAVKKECLKLWANGYCDPAEFDRGWMAEWESKMGPFKLMDLIGLDTVYNIEMSYYAASGDENDLPPQKLKDMVDAGILGMKSGSGFYPHYDSVSGNISSVEETDKEK